MFSFLLQILLFLFDYLINVLTTILFMRIGMGTSTNVLILTGLVQYAAMQIHYSLIQPRILMQGVF